MKRPVILGLLIATLVLIVVSVVGATDQATSGPGPQFNFKAIQ